MHLEVCSGCARHVRADAAVCLFCDATRDGLSRRDLLALGASLAALGCRPSTSARDTSIVQPYGAPIPTPPPDASPPAVVDASPEPQVAAIAPPYGIAPRPAPPPMLQWTLSASSERLSLAARGSWRVRVEARNVGGGFANPGAEPLSFRVNGASSQVADLAFSNGIREARWESLPAGESVRDERGLGEALLRAPGRYTIELRVGGRDQGRITVVVVP